MLLGEPSSSLMRQDTRSVRIVLDDLVLRPWCTDDEVSLVRHANSRNIWRNVRDHFPSPYTEQDAKLWIKIANRDTSMISLAIETAGEAVGGIGVVFKDDVYQHTAEIGYWLGEAYWNRGLTSRAVVAVSDYAFEHCDIIRLYAGVFEHNTASARVLEKAGYALEARLRKGIIKDGQVMDELIYSKFA